MYVKSVLSFIFIEILSSKDKRVFNAKKMKITKSGKLKLKLLDCPWTQGAQYLLPRFYLVGEVRFYIGYKNVARNTKLKSLIKISKNAIIMKFHDFDQL